MSLHDKSCLYSVVRNISGGTLVFGFLPPHGVQLTANEEYEIFGSVLEALSNGRSRGAARRQHKAFFDSIDRGDIEIMNLPSPILLDTVAATPKTLQSASGTITGITPCWSSTSTTEANSETPA